MYNLAKEGFIMTYYAIIGDIKNSRKLEHRKDIQNKLKTTLDYINERYIHNIASNFTITLGDEFQGLLLDSKYVYEIVSYIQRNLFPVEIRFGIGIGEITTEINREISLGADGPAYYAAREMINELHKKEAKLKKKAPNILVSFFGKDSYQIEEINMMFAFAKIIEDSWSPSQRMIILDKIEHNDTQQNIAKKHGITQATVSRDLNNGYLTQYTELINTIPLAFSRMENTNV